MFCIITHETACSIQVILYPFYNLFHDCETDFVGGK